MDKNVLSQFINNISQFVWWKDLNSVFLGCNDNLLRYSGLKNKEDILKRMDSNDKKHDALLEKHNKLNLEHNTTLQSTKYLVKKVKEMDDEDKTSMSFKAMIVGMILTMVGILVKQFTTKGA